MYTTIKITCKKIYLMQKEDILWSKIYMNMLETTENKDRKRTA